MSYRIERINSEMQRAISDIIQNGLKDPRVSEMVSVLSVDTAKDLKTAKVYISIYGDEEKSKSTFEALKNTGGFIKKQLSLRFKDMRIVPTLTFILDTSMQYSEKINNIMRTLNAKVNDNDE